MSLLLVLSDHLNNTAWRIRPDASASNEHGNDKMQYDTHAAIHVTYLVAVQLDQHQQRGREQRELRELLQEPLGR